MRVSNFSSNVKKYFPKSQIIPLKIKVKIQVVALMNILHSVIFPEAPTVHTVTFGVAHIETGGLHVCRKNIPPFILVTQGGLSASWTRLTCWGMDTVHN